MSRDRKEIKLPFGVEISFWHLEESQLSYLQHMRRAFGFALICALACAKATIHGLVPCWFEDTSDEVFEYINKF